MHAIEFAEQTAAIVEPGERKFQVHVLLQLAAAAGIEGRIGRAERAGVAELAEAHGPCLRAGVHGAREQGHIRRHAGAGAIGAGNARIDGAEVGAEGVAADDGLDVVIAVAGDERTHDSELVGLGGELCEGAAEGDAGQLRRNLAGGAANLDRRGHLGIERLGLAGTAVQEEEDDRLVGDKSFVTRRPRLGGEQVRQRQATQGKTADREESSAIERASSVMDGEHTFSPCTRNACMGLESVPARVTV